MHPHRAICPAVAALLVVIAAGLPSLSCRDAASTAGARPASTAGARPASTAAARPASATAARPASTPPIRSTRAACEREPLTPFRAFREILSDSEVTRFRGTLLAVSEPDRDALRHYRIRSDDGQETGLAADAGAGALPLHLGTEYGFRVEVVGGSPAACALTIVDGAGLVFAGVSDQGIGAHVLSEGVPGLDLALLPADCPSRPHDACLESIANRPLRARRGRAQVTLHHGEKAALGPLVVECRVAQDARYRSRCADAGQIAVSYVISRVR